MKIFDLGKTDKPRYYESRVSSVSVDKKAKINSQSQNTHNNISRPLLMEFDNKFYLKFDDKSSSFKLTAIDEEINRIEKFDLQGILYDKNNSEVAVCLRDCDVERFNDFLKEEV